jgi:hypothetical protein
MFTISFQDKRNGEWTVRTVVEAETASAALRAYCPSLRKQGKIKHGTGTTNRGRKVRATAVEAEAPVKRSAGRPKGSKNRMDSWVKLPA